jgi:hypothetical protein
MPLRKYADPIPLLEGSFDLIESPFSSPGGDGNYIEKGKKGTEIPSVPVTSIHHKPEGTGGKILEK